MINPMTGNRADCDKFETIAVSEIKGSRVNTIRDNTAILVEEGEDIFKEFSTKTAEKDRISD